MKPRILIVDDNEKSRFLLSEKMTADGYEVETARDGVEGLKKVETFKPDLILLDIMMPRMDGYEMCRRLKSNEETRYISVIMLTARGELDDKVMGLEMGAEDYIVKPYSLVEVSARVKSLLRVKMLQAKLREAEKLAALGEMVDSIAHEVRNPLVSIGGMARRLYEHESNPSHKKYLEIIITYVQRLEKMMERIDEYKSILAPHMSMGNINEVIEEAVEEAKGFIGDKDITIKTELMPGAPEFEMDRKHLKIAFLNLLHNSVDAIENKGEITISTLPAEGNVLVVKISDTGCGMESEVARRIFHPFFTSKVTGAGLGLTIAYRVIENHNGDIEVDTEKGRGTTFTIRFHLKGSRTPEPFSV